MGVEHGQCGQSVPSHVPYHLFPSLDLNVILYGEWGSSFLPHVGEFCEFGIFVCRIQMVAGKDANLSVFRSLVFHDTRGMLDSTDPSLVELVVGLERTIELTLPRSLG